jgi:hypothetical protein
MLHDMLEKMATVGDASIVSWQPHGKAFRVHHPEAFARTVMPNYFKQTKYKSFQRQLHMYGFQRIRKGLDTGSYFHSMFIRNKKSMSLQMSCQKIKGENAVQRHVSGDPNFYSSDNPMLQASTTSTEEKQKASCREQGPATVLTTDDEKPLIGNSALLLNQEVAGDPSASDQLLDWMEQAQPIISTSPCRVSASSAYEKGDDASVLLHWVDHQRHDDEGFFEGKRFFDVMETKSPMMVDFSAIVDRGGRTFYMPRSA